jgi:hypothetical protein
MKDVARLTEAARQLTPNLNTDKPSMINGAAPVRELSPTACSRWACAIPIRPTDTVARTAARGYFADTSPIFGVAAKGHLYEDRCDR